MKNKISKFFSDLRQRFFGKRLTAEQTAFEKLYRESLAYVEDYKEDIACDLALDWQRSLRRSQEELDAKPMPILTEEDKERITRGGQVSALADQLVTGGDSYNFLFKPHTMDELYSPAAVEERQRCLKDLIAHARAYAACPQMAPAKDEPDLEPD